MFRVLSWIFAILWPAALAVWAIGTWGLFGQQIDPLAGLFLIPLGLPWTMLGGSLPPAALPVLGVVAPGLNLLILIWLARRFSTDGRR